MFLMISFKEVKKYLLAKTLQSLVCLQLFSLVNSNLGSLDGKQLIFKRICQQKKGSCVDIVLSSKWLSRMSKDTANSLTIDILHLFMYLLLITFFQK